MAEDDRAYYQRRAEVEAALAQQLAMSPAGKAHSALAAAYLERLSKADFRQASAS